MAQIIFGASDGIRTRDGRNHNPGLYQLSYARHRSPRKLYRKVIRDARFGAHGGTRTPDRRIRNPLLYPAELRAHGGRVRRSECSTRSEPPLAVRRWKKGPRPGWYVGSRWRSPAESAWIFLSGRCPIVPWR